MSFLLKISEIPLIFHEPHSESTMSLLIALRLEVHSKSQHDDITNVSSNEMETQYHTQKHDEVDLLCLMMYLHHEFNLMIAHSPDLYKTYHEQTVRIFYISHLMRLYKPISLHEQSSEVLAVISKLVLWLETIECPKDLLLDIVI